MLSWACLATTLSLLLLLPLLNHQHRKNVFATVSESIGGDTIDVIVMESPDFIPVTRQLKINNSSNSSWKILWTTELLSTYIHIRMQNNISIIMSLVVLSSSFSFSFSSSLAVIPSRIITRCYF
jgi:hypothetical protein